MNQKISGLVLTFGITNLCETEGKLANTSKPLIMKEVKKRLICKKLNNLSYDPQNFFC